MKSRTGKIKLLFKDAYFDSRTIYKARKWLKVLWARIVMRKVDTGTSVVLRGSVDLGGGNPGVCSLYKLCHCNVFYNVKRFKN